MIVGKGAVLDGSAPVPLDQWKLVGGGVYRFHPPHMGFQQLFVDDRPAARVAVGHAAVSLPKLEPRQWCAFQGDIFFRVENLKMPADYRLTYACLPTGITLYNVEQVAIIGLTVQRFAVDGINALNSARGVRLATVACRDNGRYGVAVGGASQVDIDSCLSSGNGAGRAVHRGLLRNARLPEPLAGRHGAGLGRSGRPRLLRRQARARRPRSRGTR